MVLVLEVGAVEEQRRRSVAEPIAWPGNGRVNSGLQGVAMRKLETVNHQGRGTASRERENQGRGNGK